MQDKHIAILCVLAVVLIMLSLMRDEGFTSTQEKATAIYNWFTANPSGTYGQYKNDLSKMSNIIEYEDALTLKRAGDLSVSSIEKKL